MKKAIVLCLLFFIPQMIYAQNNNWKPNRFFIDFGLNYSGAYYFSSFKNDNISWGNEPSKKMGPTGLVMGVNLGNESFISKIRFNYHSGDYSPLGYMDISLLIGKSKFIDRRVCLEILCGLGFHNYFAYSRYEDIDKSTIGVSLEGNIHFIPTPYVGLSPYIFADISSAYCIGMGVKLCVIKVGYSKNKFPMYTTDSVIERLYFNH